MYEGIYSKPFFLHTFHILSSLQSFCTQEFTNSSSLSASIAAASVKVVILNGALNLYKEFL